MQPRARRQVRRRQVEGVGVTEPPSEARVMLATRVPRVLRKRVRLFCVEHGCDMLDFIAEAIRERLRRRQRV